MLNIKIYFTDTLCKIMTLSPINKNRQKFIIEESVMAIQKSRNRKKNSKAYLVASLVSLVVAIGVMFAGIKFIEKVEESSILKYEVTKIDKKK
jgi:hypothetical protein